MEFSGLEQLLTQWLSGIAYHPYELYGTIVVFMLMSGFGLPIPEEVVLVSSGLIAYAGSRPDLYPPPTPDAAVVNPYTLAAVCFLAVLLSDLLVFTLGRVFGQRIARSDRFGKFVDPRKNPKLGNLRRNYGVWACGVFRFTPVLRFPGHMSCGIMRIPYWKFASIDGGAALVSVPTQVILVSLYGEVIVSSLKQTEIVLFSILLVAGLGYGAYRLLIRMQDANKLDANKAGPPPMHKRATDQTNASFSVAPPAK